MVKCDVKDPFQSKHWILDKPESVKIAGTAYNKKPYMLLSLIQKIFLYNNTSVPVGNIVSNSLHISIQNTVYFKNWKSKTMEAC